MRVLLLNPPGPFCRAGSRWPHKRKPRKVGIDYHPFPFQLGYAASRLLSDRHDVQFVDCIASNINNDALARIADDFAADVVFMETSAPSWQFDLETVKRLGRLTIAGGAHATATPREHLDAGFDAVILGEYDQVLPRALDLSPQPWLATGGSPDATHAPMVRDLDELPSPAWHLMPMEKYNDPFCLGRSVTVLTSRGCPLECGFCTIAPFEGKRNYRRRDPKAVCDEIAQLIERYNPDEIYFDDDTITINRRHILALCDEYRSRNFGIPWSCMGNAVIDSDVIAAMAKSGCRAIKFGVESADPEVLRQIPKDQDPRDVQRTVRDLNRHGIQSHANFLFGLAGETEASARRTIEYAVGLGTQTLQFAIATPYPGTAFYAKAEANGWLTKTDWRQFDPAGEAVVSYPGYNAEQIAAMHDFAWKRWQRHMMLRRPRTLLHHFGNAYRRQGFGGMARLGYYGASRLFGVLGAH